MHVLSAFQARFLFGVPMAMEIQPLDTSPNIIYNFGEATFLHTMGY
jgi:hypothetical protein